MWTDSGKASSKSLSVPRTGNGCAVGELGQKVTGGLTDKPL